MRHAGFGPPIRALVVLLALAAVPAKAEAPDVEQLVSEGIELRVQGREAAALERFSAAAGLEPSSPRVLGHLALALHAQGRWVESERVMLTVLDSAGDDWVVRHHEELRHSLEAVRGHLGWLEIDAPDGADVSLDGEPIGVSPISGPRRVLAGAHTVLVRVPGRVPLQKTLGVPAGRHLYLSLTDAIPERPGPLAPSAPLRTEKCPATRPARAAGVHRTLGAALLGAGSIGVLAGIALGVNAFVQRRERDQLCDQSGCSEDGIALDARARQSAAYSNVAFVAGLASAGVGAVLAW